MPLLNSPYRTFYTAVDYLTGLTDVQAYVKRPDNVLEGPFTLTELTDTGLSGTYYFDYTMTLTGVYLFTVDCVSNPKRAEKSVECIQGSPFLLF